MKTTEEALLLSERGLTLLSFHLTPATQLDIVIFYSWLCETVFCIENKYKEFLPKRCSLVFASSWENQYFCSQTTMCSAIWVGGADDPIVTSACSGLCGGVQRASAHYLPQSAAGLVGSLWLLSLPSFPVAAGRAAAGEQPQASAHASSYHTGLSSH